MINRRNNHKYISYDIFKEMYYKDNYANITFNLLLIMKRYYIQCLLENNKVINYIDSKY